MTANNLKIEEIGISKLPEYAAIPMTYEVHAILQISASQNGLGGFSMKEIRVDKPYLKDCNMHGDSGPVHWPKRFNLDGWGIYLAYMDSIVAGGFTIAPPTAGIVANERRIDTAALWDLRVMPEHRRRGIGRRLLDVAIEWTKSKGLTYLAIETMNVNVPACRLYSEYGCELSEIRRFAYENCAEVAHESLLVWRIKVN